MAIVLRGTGLLAIVLLVSACGGPAGIGITSGDWDKVYQASLAYENAMGIASRSAQTWQASRADRDKLQAVRQQVGQLTSEAQAAMAESDCTADGLGQVCAAVKALRDTSGGSLMARAQTNLGTAEAALTTFQHTHDTLLYDYAMAGESWNAWLRTLMLVVANYDQVSAWPDFGRRRDEALGAVQGFVKSGEDQELATQYGALTAALRPLDESVAALSQVIVTARGQGPETVATGATAAGTATGIAQTQTGAASSVPLAPGLSIDPTGIVQQLISSEYQLQQAREKNARDQVLAQLQELLWPDYSCFVTPTPACPSFVSGRPHALGADARLVR
jgi:hypothetical protein